MGGRQNSFLCPVGTLFSQETFVCDWWFNVNCGSAPSLYDRNANLYRGPNIGLDGPIGDSWRNSNSMPNNQQPPVAVPSWSSGNVGISQGNNMFDGNIPHSNEKGGTQGFRGQGQEGTPNSMSGGRGYWQNGPTGGKGQTNQNRNRNSQGGGNTWSNAGSSGGRTDKGMGDSRNQNWGNAQGMTVNTGMNQGGSRGFNMNQGMSRMNARDGSWNQRSQISNNMGGDANIGHGQKGENRLGSGTGNQNWGQGLQRNNKGFNQNQGAGMNPGGNFQGQKGQQSSSRNMQGWGQQGTGQMNPGRNVNHMKGGRQSGMNFQGNQQRTGLMNPGGNVHPMKGEKQGVMNFQGNQQGTGLMNPGGNANRMKGGRQGGMNFQGNQQGHQGTGLMNPGDNVNHMKGGRQGGMNFQRNQGVGQQNFGGLNQGANGIQLGEGHLRANFQGNQGFRRQNLGGMDQGENPTKGEVHSVGNQHQALGGRQQRSKGMNSDRNANQFSGGDQTWEQQNLGNEKGQGSLGNRLGTNYEHRQQWSSNQNVNQEQFNFNQGIQQGWVPQEEMGQQRWNQEQNQGGHHEWGQQEGDREQFGNFIDGHQEWGPQDQGIINPNANFNEMGDPSRNLGDNQVWEHQGPGVHNTGVNVKLIVRGAGNIDGQQGINLNSGWEGPYEGNTNQGVRPQNQKEANKNQGMRHRRNQNRVQGSNPQNHLKGQNHEQRNRNVRPTGERGQFPVDRNVGNKRKKEAANQKPGSNNWSIRSQNLEPANVDPDYVFPLNAMGRGQSQVATPINDQLDVNSRPMKGENVNGEW